jgi:hypothetical protein
MKQDRHPEPFPANRRPGDQMTDRRKMFHLHPNLGDQGLGTDPADPGDGGQSLHDFTKGLDNPLNLLVELLQPALQLLAEPQMLPQQEAVMGG